VIYEDEPKPTDLLQQLRNRLGIDAELLRTAAHFHSRRLELEIRIDAYRDTSRESQRRRQSREQRDFARRFDVHQHPGRNCLTQLRLLLARPCETDVPRSGTGIQRHLELTRRSDI